MRIGIVNNQVPFVTGGAERLAASLCGAFRERGFDATEISMPFRWYPAGKLVDHVMAAKLLDLSEVEGAPVDLMVGLKFPAYLARHPDKVFWILHQHRQAYDMWESGMSDLPGDPDGAAVRALIHEEDRAALGAPGGTVCTISRNVSARMRRFLGIGSTPLYHPPPQAGLMRQGDYGDYLFAPSRMNAAKRQTLMLEALAAGDRATRIVFAGPADNPRFMDDFRARARALGVEDRVTLLGAVDDETMRRCYAECRAVVFIPIDEDYGYVTLEAMLSGKPVITATDSGGPLEFVEDGAEGLVVAPESRALAAAFDALSGDPARAQALGEAGRARYAAMNIGWDTVVSTLTAGRESVGGRALDADPAAGLRALSRATVPTADERTAAPPSPSPEEEPDLAALKAAIAPDLPDVPPFASARDLLAAYDFATDPSIEPPDMDMLDAYFDTHWQRYLATLKLVLAGRTDRVLDIGIFPPFLFQAMVTAARPDARIDGIWEGPARFAQTVAARRGDLADFRIALEPANVERDPLPHPDSTFDLVTGMEILEHCAVDPLFFLSEAARVLRPGGRIVLTTPNIASHRGVRKILDGEAPYSFGSYVPTHGVHGRHNREFAPREVEALCAAAGFETESLHTVDLYDDTIDPEVARLLDGHGSFALRGETILYAGRLERHAPPGPPGPLYHGDPRRLSGRLHLAGRDRESGRTRVGVTNTSPLLWHVSGEGSISLRLKWYDARGALVHDGGTLPLDGPLAPGGSGEVSLLLSPAAGGGESAGTIGIDLHQPGADTLTPAGRANGLRLPCAEAAFLRIMRGKA